MRKGRVPEADALTLKIRKAVIDFNSVSFKGMNSRSGAKELWDNVRVVTGKTKGAIKSDCVFNADQLNAHYEKQSTDVGHLPPNLKSSVLPCTSVVVCSELLVYNLLNNIRATAQGTDCLPYWFLKACACFIAKPVAHIYNLSLSSSCVPRQWKEAVIIPLPKTSNPTSCSDFRPISLTPILSRLLEKAVIRYFVYPLFTHPTSCHLFHDQFAFRPTGSTESAIISILHHVTLLLSSHQYVRIIALDFSKAFDTVRHSTTRAKLSSLPIDDNIYNWFVNYFFDHTHVTKYCSTTSQPASINAGVFQGSAVGPAMYVVNSSDLKPIDSSCYNDKYADDNYLIVGASCEDCIPSESH